MMPQFAYIRPATLKEAVRQLEDKDTYVYGGGTDLLTCLRENLFEVAKVVSINALDDLHGVDKTADGGLRIGALTTIAEVSENPDIQKRYSALARGASEVASPQLRNQGTIGGNLCQKPRCWYYRGEFDCLRKGGDTCFAADGENQFHCIFGSGDICYIVHPSDTAPALVALNARLEITGPGGSRTLAAADLHVLPADDVRRETWLDPGEVITAVRIPAPPPNLRSSYRKIRARRSWDFALAGVALALQFEDDVVAEARVVLSGAAPVPWRAKPVEDALRGKPLNRQAIGAAAEAVVDGARPLAKNGYKIPLFSGLIEEELERLASSAIV
jgi:xanthine dehydrogenase YagS FAD-binding subunit